MKLDLVPEDRRRISFRCLIDRGEKKGRRRRFEMEPFYFRVGCGATISYAIMAKKKEEVLLLMHQRSGA
jgi:hypothetical protein